jgi:MFS family permease
VTSAEPAEESLTGSEAVIAERGRRGWTAATTSADGVRTEVDPLIDGVALPRTRPLVDAPSGTLGARFYVLIAISGVTFGMTYVQAVSVAHALGAGTVLAGVLVSLMAVTMFGMDLVGARFVPRLEGRFGLSASLVIYGVGNLLVGFGRSLWMMAAGRLFEGIGVAVFMTLGVQLVIRLSEPHRRGHAIGAFNAAWFLGIAVGPAFGGWLATLSGRPGAQLAFIGCGVISCLTAVLLRTTMHRYPSPLRPEFALPRLRSVRGGRLWSAVTLGGLGEAMRDGIQMVLIPLAAMQLGMSPLATGVAIGALTVVDVISMQLSGRATDRFGRAPVLIIASISGIGVLLVSPVAQAPLALIVLCVLMGPSQAAIWVVPPAMVSDLAEDREAAVCAYRLATDVAFGCGATGAAVIGSALGGTAGLAASAAGFVLAVALTLVVGETNPRTQRRLRAA